MPLQSTLLPQLACLLFEYVQILTLPLRVQLKKLAHPFASVHLPKNYEKAGLKFVHGRSKLVGDGVVPIINFANVSWALPSSYFADQLLPGSILWRYHHWYSSPDLHSCVWYWLLQSLGEYFFRIWYCAALAVLLFLLMYGCFNLFLVHFSLFMNYILSFQVPSSQCSWTDVSSNLCYSTHVWDFFPFPQLLMDHICDKYFSHQLRFFVLPVHIS